MHFINNDLGWSWSTSCRNNSSGTCISGIVYPLFLGHKPHFKKLLEIENTTTLPSLLYKSRPIIRLFPEMKWRVEIEDYYNSFLQNDHLIHARVQHVGEFGKRFWPINGKITGQWICYSEVTINWLFETYIPNYDYAYPIVHFLYFLSIVQFGNSTGTIGAITPLYKPWFQAFPSFGHQLEGTLDRHKRGPRCGQVHPAAPASKRACPTCKYSLPVHPSLTSQKSQEI